MRENLKPLSGNLSEVETGRKAAQIIHPRPLEANEHCLLLSRPRRRRAEGALLCLHLDLALSPGGM